MVAQSCPTLCDPLDCSSPGSSVCGFLQARILVWGAIPFSSVSELVLNCLESGGTSDSSLYRYLED